MQLYAGAAKACITPNPETFPIRMWLDHEIQDVYSDLYCRTLVLHNEEDYFAILSFDLMGVPHEEITKKKVSDATGIPKENILLTATHNHASPLNANAEQFRDDFINGAVESAVKAKASLKRARYGFGEGRSYININRDCQLEDGSWYQGSNPEGFSDKTLSIIKFETLDGVLISAILNYSLTEISTFVSNDVDGKGKISGGAVGFAADYIERRFGNDAVILWTSAPAGDQYNRFIGLRSYSDQGIPQRFHEFDGAKYAVSRQQGQVHGIDAIKILNEIECGLSSMNFAKKTVVVKLPAQCPPPGADMAYNRLLVDYMLPLNEDGTYPEYRPVIMQDDPDNPVDLTCSLVILGDIALYCIGAQPYNRIGVLCKEASPYKNTMVLSNVGGSAGFVIDKASAHHKTFTAYGRIKPGVADDIIVDTMLDLFSEIK